jgi:hypothetical protein
MKSLNVLAALALTGSLASVAIADQPMDSDPK